MITSPAPKITRLATLKSPADFRAYCASLGIDIPCDDMVVTSDSPIGRPAEVAPLGEGPPGSPRPCASSSTGSGCAVVWPPWWPF